MHTDPLLEYERRLIECLSKPTLLHRLFGGARFLMIYLILSGTIFSVLLGILNFGAYSTRVLSWIDPQAIEGIKNDLQHAISQSSIEVHATDTNEEEHQESREALTEKVANTDPGIVYSRSYDASHLLGSISSTDAYRTSFELSPYENRIIIPKLGKNIPLVDVINHDEQASFEQMHEVFMEELKK
jgi:hypothetical protein